MSSEDEIKESGARAVSEVLGMAEEISHARD
jgi:hypothetical protein